MQLGVEPLIFPGGERPTSPQEFARACFRWWNFALGLLHDGKVSAFLRGCGMANLADWLQQSQGDASPDTVLDALLRRLEPGLPPPAVEPSVQHISLGVVTPGLQTAVPLLLLSRGGLAQVAVTSSLPWLQFYPEHLLIRPGEQEQVQLCASPDYASHGQIRGSLQLQVYDAQARLVSTQKVQVSAEVGAGTRARPGRVDMLWLLMILTSALVVLMLLWTLRPPGWSLLSVICVGLTAGGIAGWVLNGAGDLSLLLMHTLLGALGAIAGGLIVPLFILKRALPLLSAGQMAGALLGAVLAPLLVHLFFES
ncbi:MAG: hypothetical protein KatS3mg057_3099 [Herpetosiphonaceae bacterium]|nr:MAG: hypothetical protein KatS3mg057_3099 [Herpetosiphonaceae bacterium]